MKTVVEMLRGISTLVVVIYLFMVVNGLMKDNLMTYQWILLLIVIAMWFLIRIFPNEEGEENNVE